MAYHFSANQFEEGYKAKRLRNWEIPKWYPEHPRTPLTTTKFIADSRGHLFPGVPKSNPWGNYKSTWDLPKRITKEYADFLNGPPRKLQTLWGKRRAPEHVQQQTDQSEPEKLPVLSPAAEGSFQRRNRSSTALDLQSSSPTKFEPLLPLPEPQPIKSPPIERGTLDDRLRSILEDAAVPQPKPEEPVLCRAIEALHQGKGEERQEVDLVKHTEMVSDKKEFGGPLINDYSAFQIAKRFHDENLKHQPLPDAVDDPVFKALASNKDPFPGKSLEIQSSAAAIGWKESGVPGPTKCSKVKVYRPKTGVSKPKSKAETRPKTCDPEKKDKRFMPIDLAICWDLAPHDKPRRALHIDGSGGGEAPSVFAVVRPEDREILVTGSAQAVATHVPTCTEEDNVGTLPPKIGEKVGSPPKKVENRTAIMNHVKPIPESRSSFHSLSPQSAEIARKNPKTAWTVQDTSKALSERLEELQKTSDASGTRSNDTMKSSPLLRHKHHQSTPNLTSVSCQTKKQCDGSQCGTDSTSEKKSPKSKESKESKRIVRPRNAVTPPPVSRTVKIPKMRPPYAKKNYSIGTLIPPFSLWPDHHGQEYPEHWRLASVYQHSYKPVDCRRKPLLASVYQ